MEMLAPRQMEVVTSSANASKIKITNIVSYFTCAVALFYALYFWLSLQQPFLAGLNLLFVFGYAASLLLSRYKFYQLSKYWFFAVLLLHVYLLTTLVFSPSAGFHFYYLLLPTGVFLLLDEKDKYARIVIMAIGSGLFFLCHNSTNPPLVSLTKEAEYWIFSSTIIVIITEIYVVMSIFSKAISIHELELKNLAMIDPLTGVNNRRTFVSIGEELLLYANRYQKAFSLILIDIDYFKSINDSYGHQVGDKTLKMIASTLKNNIRESDLLARYGGEEFVILLPETNVIDAKKLAENLRKAIAVMAVPISADDNLHCTASFGIAERTLFNHTQGLMELVNQADEALYKAKKSGRDQVVVKS